MLIDKSKIKGISPVGAKTIKPSVVDTNPFIAMNKCIVVERFEEKLTSASGIYISSGEAKTERPAQGIIRYISDDVDGDLKVGDIVVFGRYAKMMISLERYYSLLNEMDILGTVTIPPEQ